ncbi:hypothetical protein D3C81_1233620 [compost metagenome]
MPAISANVVIRMGRKRMRPAYISASSRPWPSSSRLRAASSSRMAFLATSPISMIMPIKLIRLRVLFVITSATTTPIKLSGKDIITATGAVNEPNCITRIKYIRPIPITSAISISVNSSCWSWPAPPRARP